MNTETFLTIEKSAEAKYVEKKSSFLSFALPVQSEEEVKDALKQFRKTYYDARHICYAFRLYEGNISHSSDNGEPPGTAGKPILGNILSRNLTNVLIVVVRYFGGIKLGTSGLSAAYKLSTEMCLKDVSVVERFELSTWTFDFDYLQMDKVMQNIKMSDVRIVSSQMELTCHIEIEGSKSSVEALREKLEKLCITKKQKTGANQ